MMRVLVAIILALPLLEIAGFVVIGGRIGLGLTLLWLLAAGLLGLALIRDGGLKALRGSFVTMVMREIIKPQDPLEAGF